MEDKTKDTREEGMNTDDKTVAGKKDAAKTKITRQAKEDEASAGADGEAASINAERDGTEDGTGDGADENMASTGEGSPLEQQLEDLKKKNDEYYERLLRLQADFDNYRKRTAREKEEIYDYIAGEILLDFLGVLDNMERASASAAGDGGSDGGASLREGIDMVVKQLRDILAKYNVEEIPTERARFDPNFHHAVMRVQDTGKEEGTILEVFQKGYKIKSRVLRPSVVKVAL